MAITYFGSTSSPADNGTSTATTITLTPPASMTAGDLVYVQCRQRGTATFSVGVDGGQTWNSLTRATGTNIAHQAFWCRFNGTWGANPRFDFSAGTNTNAFMVVFRPTDTGKEWAVDTAESNGSFTAGTTPFTKTITGYTPNNDNNVSIASWITADDNTWGSLSGTNWTKASLSAQYRNTSGSDMSATFAYQIQTTAAGTNNVSQNQATLGGDAGRTSIITFYEYSPPTTVDEAETASASESQTHSGSASQADTASATDAQAHAGTLSQSDTAAGTESQAHAGAASHADTATAGEAVTVSTSMPDEAETAAAVDAQTHGGLFAQADTASGTDEFLGHAELVIAETASATEGQSLVEDGGVTEDTLEISDTATAIDAPGIAGGTVIDDTSTAIEGSAMPGTVNNLTFLGDQLLFLGDPCTFTTAGELSDEFIGYAEYVANETASAADSHSYFDGEPFTPEGNLGLRITPARKTLTAGGDSAGIATPAASAAANIQPTRRSVSIRYRRGGITVRES